MYAYPRSADMCTLHTQSQIYIYTYIIYVCMRTQDIQICAHCIHNETHICIYTKNTYIRKNKPLRYVHT